MVSSAGEEQSVRCVLWYSGVMFTQTWTALPPSCVQFKSIACSLTQSKVLFLEQEQQTSSMQCKDTLLYICLFYSCLVFYFIFSLYIKTNKLFLKMVSLPH